MTSEELIERGRALSAMISMGERTGFGQDSTMIDALADHLEAHLKPGQSDGPCQTSGDLAELVAAAEEAVSFSIGGFEAWDDAAAAHVKVKRRLRSALRPFRPTQAPEEL